MDIAIVTGAETPLGLSLIQRLVRQGYRVHGIGNNFSKVTYADPQFKAHPVDLSDLAAVSGALQAILDEEKSLDLLIHALDVTPGAAFEKLSVGNLEAVLKIGLLGPVMLTRLALPNLLRFRGQLINVIPANKSGNPASAVNALIEGGLRSMNAALFDRARDAGLRVTNLVLRQNAEPDALSVQSSTQTHIDLEDVARAVEHLIDPNFANVPAELVLYPRSSAHSDHVLPELPEPLDPYCAVVLPPKEYCPPEQPKIQTPEKVKVERTIPYTDDEMEDRIAAAIEDFEAHPERYDVPDVKPGHRKPAAEHRLDPQEGGSSNKRRRGRRRGGRNRNPNAQSLQDGSQKPQEDASPSREGAARMEDRKPSPDAQHQPESGQGSDKPKSKSRRSGRGRPKPQGKGQSASQPQSDQKSQSDNKPGVKPEPKPDAPKKAPVKKAAKKSAKKAAKKTAKKAPAKKATKKTVKKKAAKKVSKPSADSE
jgi:NAD(P)-dependent dehydrogenase (short-subunit alcohol dehydrogenase family)